MFDHLHGAHRLNEQEANEMVAALAPSAGWRRSGAFVPRRPRSGVPTTARSAAIKERPATPPSNDWEELIDYLIEIIHIIHRDRLIPKYQFERHVDSLLVPFLPEILARRLGGVFRVVASEFPVKKLDNDQSTNADALLHQRSDSGAETWWLFELKTDTQSVRTEQLQPYARACVGRMQDLVHDLETITAASNAKHKYGVVRDLLAAIEASFDAPVRLVYLSPHPVRDLERISGSVGIVFDDLLNLELVNRAPAWRLVRDHLLAPVVGR